MTSGSTHRSLESGTPVMHPSFEIEARLTEYLTGRQSLSELREWFRTAAGALLALPPGSEALELATLLALALIEHDQGFFTERQLKQQIRKALKPTIHYVIEQAPELTATASETQPLSISAPTTTGNATISIQSLSTGT
jgi:hypothetical protein